MGYLPDSIQETKRKNKVSRKKIDEVDKKEHDELLASRAEHNEFEAQRVDEAIENNIREVGKDIKIKRNIVYEEIIEPTGNYIRDEVTQLFEFYMTVDRYTGTKLYGLANLMTSYNPYFDHFGIRPFTQEFKWFKKNTLLVQNVKIPGMDSFVKSQRFYNLVEGTEYGDYLTNNTPWQDDNFGIEKRPAKAILRYNLRLHDELIGVWEYAGILYISKKNNPQMITFAGGKSIKEDDYPIRKNESAHKLLNYASENGVIRFESIPLRELTYEVINGGFKNA